MLSAMLNFSSKTTIVRSASLQKLLSDKYILNLPRVSKLNNTVYVLTNASRRRFEYAEDAFLSINCIQCKL